MILSPCFDIKNDHLIEPECELCKVVELDWAGYRGMLLWPVLPDIVEFEEIVWCMIMYKLYSGVSGFQESLNPRIDLRSRKPNRQSNIVGSSLVLKT